MIQPDAGGTILPDFDKFAARHGRAAAQVVWRTHVNDTDTPVSAFLKIAGTDTNAFLLESVEGGENLGRYSIIGLKPDLIWRARGGKAEICRDPAAERPAYKTVNLPMLPALRELLEQSRIDLPPETAQLLPPMFAGVFGYFGYETVHELETLPQAADNNLDLYDSILVRPTVLAVFDNISREITIITPVRHQNNVSAQSAYADAVSRLDNISTALANNHATSPTRIERETQIEFKSNWDQSEFEELVNQAKAYIRAGDIFQVVLSQRFSAPFEVDPFLLYRALRRLNPSPFLFYLNFADCTLVGSSPEILVRVRDGEVTIRPIAGTRPRGATADADIALEQELLADPKERAEHLMLLDLGRNDVARSSRIGSVQVTQSFEVERYSHVMHIVSNVTGALAEDADAVDALMAGFPAGTVSGAPKIRAMEIIAELEKDQRGPYSGCIGYFSADGNVDTCIALRTAVIKDAVMHVQAGAGIVADSDAAAENLECFNKANALFRAAADAVARSSSQH